MTYDQGWMHGNIFSIRKVLIIGTIISLVIFPFSYWLINRPRTNANTVFGKDNQILFPCSNNPCWGNGVWSIENGSPTLIETVNATYSCNCTTSVTFIYSPSIVRVLDNGTQIVQEHLIPPNQSLLVQAYAYRTEGTGNVTVSIGVSP